MGFKQNSDNPGTYSVYLSIKHPFDARNDEAREIFLNEYRAYYSPELTDRGMVDWMEAEDLIEWLKENHPEYDGLIVDEGGTGGYGEAVKSRGDSYLPFEPNQIKSVDNTGEFDPGNPNIFYQSSKEPAIFRREDYAWAFRKTGDNRYAISKINSVIGSLMKELQKRKIDPETKERITRTLRSAIGYKGYLTRVRQARSLVDNAIRKASGLENTFTEMRPKPVLNIA